MISISSTLILLDVKQNLIELIGNCEQFLIFVNLSSSAANNNLPFLIIQAEASPCL